MRDLEREHIPVCREFGLGVLPWSPLGAGFLSGKYSRNQPPPAGVRLDKMKERYVGFDHDRGWNTLDAVRAIVAEKKTNPSAVALRWLLAKPAVTSVIFGARSLEQLDENLLAADLQLTAAEVAKLDEVSAVDFGYPYKFIANIQKRW